MISLTGTTSSDQKPSGQSQVQFHIKILEESVATQA